jgi:hypothetical protein
VVVVAGLPAAPEGGELSFSEAVRALLRLAVEEEVLGELRRGRGVSVAVEAHAGAMGSGGWSIVAAGHNHGATDAVRTHGTKNVGWHCTVAYFSWPLKFVESLCPDET